jgi:hypothetical protein
MGDQGLADVFQNARMQAAFALHQAGEVAFADVDRARCAALTAKCLDGVGKQFELGVGVHRTGPF